MKYSRRPDIVEMVIFDHEGKKTALDTGGAWCYLEINVKIIRDKNGRAAWKNPTPTGNRMIAIGFTKADGEVYDGSIHLEGKIVAAFRFGKFDDS